MPIQITKSIVKYAVADVGDDDSMTEAAPAAEAATAEPPPVHEAPRKESRVGDAKIIHMHEKVVRPEVLVGSTYKVKTPVSDHAMYVTINDIVLNQGTEYEKRRPFEIFVNSKNLDHYQWIVALTRIISAVFRKGGDVTFLVDELKDVFDPRGGYWKPGGKYMPSIIAELGEVVEEHLLTIGLLKKTQLDEHTRQILDEKKQEFEERSKQQDAFAEERPNDGAQLCKKCHTAAVVMLDGCMTCYNCGDSKCG